MLFDLVVAALRTSPCAAVCGVRTVLLISHFVCQANPAGTGRLHLNSRHGAKPRSVMAKAAPWPDSVRSVPDAAHVCARCECGQCWSCTPGPRAGLCASIELLAPLNQDHPDPLLLLCACIMMCSTAMHGSFCRLGCARPVHSPTQPVLSPESRPLACICQRCWRSWVHPCPSLVAPLDSSAARHIA